jgi:putative ABC transport system substrate-binding protein
MAQDRVDAVIIQQSVTFNPHMKRLAELALSRRLPTMHEIRAFVANGGLISYGTNTAAIGRRAASYVDRILRGTQPSDLPVEQPTKFDLIINLKAAKALGLNVPPTMLARADEVIE